MKYPIIIRLLVVCSFFIPSFVSAAQTLVKVPDNEAVYYVDDSRVRHAFPNRVTYDSWFGGDFSQVSTITPAELAQFSLGSNVVMKPGKYLVKVPSSSEVYAIEPGGVLRHVLDEKLIVSMYGSNWLHKLRDLPEVFFNNYKIGKQIRLTHQVPDGHVVRIINDDTYYWKNNSILEPFEAFSDVLSNGYDGIDVLNIDFDLFKKLKPIKNKQDRLASLIAADNVSSAMCNSDNLTAALVFVTREDKASDDELAVMSSVVENLSESWNLATDGLSNITVSNELTTMVDKDGFLLTKDQNGKTVFNFEEISLEFYETVADKYDFIILFNDFLAPQFDKEKASYRLVHNDYQGLNRIMLDRARFHGSRGRLKGIVNMNQIDQYSVTDQSGIASLLNLVHHEVLHHWGAAVTFKSDSEERSEKLLSDDQAHWNRWANWVSPLGGWGWSKTQDIEGGKGVYSSQRVGIGEAIIKLPSIDLYLMGLLPARYMSPLSYLIPDDPATVSDEVIGRLETVTIDQIQAVHGEVKCAI